MPRIAFDQNGVVLHVSARETAEWAGRWPCSQLRGHSLRAQFDARGDLIDYAVDGRDKFDVLHDEFNALTSDMLRMRLPRTHPAYYGCVGQFDDKAALDPSRCLSPSPFARPPRPARLGPPASARRRS